MHNRARGSRLVYLGRWIPLVFFTTTIICGRMLGNYNHLSRMVSELGASGTPSQYVFTAGLLVCSALSVVFVLGLYRGCKAVGISAMPPLVILSYSVSIAGAALFPLPLRMHLIAGMPSVLLFLSPLLGLLKWRNCGLAHIRLMSAISLLVMSLGFMAFVPDLLSDYSGLKQRFFHLGWSIWFVFLSYRFANLPEPG